VFGGLLVAIALTTALALGSGGGSKGSTGGQSARASCGKVWAFGTPEPNWQIWGTQSSLRTGVGGTRSTFCDIYWNNFRTQGVTSILGTVTNTSGQAIAGATVTDGSQTVTTDSNGNHVLLESNSASTYTVTVSTSGYTTQSVSVTTTSLTHTAQNFTMS
jgi:hypothetical protein